jgi:hypothetical protein
VHGTEDDVDQAVEESGVSYVSLDGLDGQAHVPSNRPIRSSDLLRFSESRAALALTVSGGQPQERRPRAGRSEYSLPPRVLEGDLFVLRRTDRPTVG